MKQFTFNTLLADNRSVVKVLCEIDPETEYIEFQEVIYEGFNVYDVLAHNQWAELERDALKAFKVEQYEQLTIDYDSKHSLEALYGLSKPSFNIR
jgi:hypothetical protein